MRNVSDKRFSENQNLHMVFRDSSETRAIYDNVEKIWYSQTRRMRFACWITKATNTHSEYAMFFLLLHTKMCK